ncbi:hypothetical protein ACI2J7_10015 [Serratia bockelmannii]|uniref:hypothetical protein n=1 Tax=Serratia TaxID=613 RepID=UPI000F8C7680|nr:hypothetical protein [Serratia marcescens]
MSWQGVPFNFVNSESAGSIFLTLSKLPVISVDTGFGWDNFFSALIGGFFPALIALLTIRHNNRASDQQRTQQTIELAETRKTQLKISEQSFNAQVLSANRQNWIINLRDSAADFTTQCNSHIYYRRLYAAESEVAVWDSGKQQQVNIYLDRILTTGANLAAAQTKIRLMLNPNEITSGAIIHTMREMMEVAQFTSTKDMPSRLFENPSEYIDFEEKFLAFVQRCLKAEWKRVKSGV